MERHETLNDFNFDHLTCRIYGSSAATSAESPSAAPSTCEAVEAR